MFKYLTRYDIDNSGAIDKKEMVGVMKAIYAMVDGNVSGAVRGGTEEKVIFTLTSRSIL